MIHLLINTVKLPTDKHNFFQILEDFFLKKDNCQVKAKWAIKEKICEQKQRRKMMRQKEERKVFQWQDDTKRYTKFENERKKYSLWPSLLLDRPPNMFGNQDFLLNSLCSLNSYWFQEKCMQQKLNYSFWISQPIIQNYKSLNKIKYEDGMGYGFSIWT